MTDQDTTNPDCEDGVDAPYCGETAPNGFYTLHGSVLERTRDLVEEYIKPDIVPLTEPGTGVQALALISKDGIEPVPASIFDSSRDKPKYRSGNATLLDLDSFIAHTNRFKDSDSIIFADNNRDHPSLTGVLDYHRVGALGDAGFLRHTSKFAFPLSDEWKAWGSIDGSKMTMRDFAAFLEDRIIDVLPVGALELNEEQSRFVSLLGGTKRIADPAKLMELSTGLQVFENSEVSNAVKLASGEGKMTFSSQHTDGQGGELSVPSLFALGIPVFANGPAYQVLARLRYRKVGAELVFFIEMWRTDRVFDHAFDEAVAQVKDETGLPVLLGKPEAR